MMDALGGVFWAFEEQQGMWMGKWEERAELQCLLATNTVVQHVCKPFGWPVEMLVEEIQAVK